MTTNFGLPEDLTIGYVSPNQQACVAMDADRAVFIAVKPAVDMPHSTAEGTGDWLRVFTKDQAIRCIRILSMYAGLKGDAPRHPQGHSLYELRDISLVKASNTGLLKLKIAHPENYGTWVQLPVRTEAAANSLIHVLSWAVMCSVFYQS